MAARWRAGRASAAPSSALVLGRDRKGRTVTVSDQQLSAHGLILGASGSGKSTTMLRILTEQIARGGSVVAIDLKGSPAFARVLAEAAAAAGRPFRIWSPDGPSHWNPLGHGNATELKDKLIATERFTEPHYQRAAERYVQTVLQVLQAAHPERAPTLEEVVRLMDPKRIPGVLRGVPRPLAVRVQDYVAELTPDQLSAIRGLGTRVAVVTESHVGRYLMPGDPASTIDLRAALSGPDVVLFSLNSSSYGVLASQIGTLVVQDLVTAAGGRLAADAPGGLPAIVAVDEFSALGGDQLAALFARGRESGMSALVATQELVDLERASRGLRDQILGNTTIKIVHRQDVPESALMVAQMIGTEMVWEETRYVGAPFGYDTGRGTRRQAERFVVHPNTIKTLPPGRAVVMAKSPRASVEVVQVSPAVRHTVAAQEDPAAPAAATRGTPVALPAPARGTQRAATRTPKRTPGRGAGRTGGRGAEL
jgi:type IV secretory pathway TraG/TraD family ATPase VirD4